ncbi:MAG: DUF3782 domain-containing protein [Synechocystis sp.]|nr:DUF3782 domain-containing protein [Synechocystis sp.]
MATTADEVWQLLGELIEAQKDTARRFQESDRRFEETKQFLKEQSQETDRRLKEQNEETDRQIKRMSKEVGKLSNRLGEFVEWQVRPAAVRLFQERGIDVHEFHPNVSVKRENGGLEIDLLVVNDTDAILIEVKSKLTQRDVDDHLVRLQKFKQFMPRYRDVNALGAVGGMVISDEVAEYAYDKGLFVLAQSGDGVVILNNLQFQPRRW